MTTIFDIIRFGNKRILLKNKDKYDYNILYNNYIPITYAYSKDKIEILQLIIEFGADINKKDGYNKKIMEYACNDNNTDLIYYLKNIKSCNDSWEDIVLILIKNEYYDTIIKIIYDNHIHNSDVLKMINLEKINDIIFSQMLKPPTILDMDILNILYNLNLDNKLIIYLRESKYTYDIYNKIIIKYIHDDVLNFIIACNIYYDTTISIIIKSNNKLYIDELVKKLEYIDKILYYSIINTNQYGIDCALNSNADYISIMNYIIVNKLLQ